METKILLLLIIGFSMISCDQSRKNINTSLKKKNFTEDFYRNDTVFKRMKLNYERYEVKYRGTLLGYAFKKKDTYKVISKILVNYPIDETDNKDSKTDYGRIIYDYRCMSCHNSKEDLDISKLNFIIKEDKPIIIDVNGNKFQYIRIDAYHWFLSDFSSLDFESMRLFLESR